MAARTAKAAKIMAEYSLWKKETGKNLYYVPKVTRWSKGVGAMLPEGYKKFWKEWKLTPPTPINWVPREGKYERWENGAVHPIQNRELPLKFPKELHQGIWGGEAVIQGFIKKGRYLQRIPKFFVPSLEQNTLYSEVLNEYMSCVTTRRTMMLIHENFGLDYYLLKTGANDLMSELALHLKRNIIQALYYKTLYPNDPEKREEIYNKYKEFVKDYTEEEVEWYGLSYKEAVKKFIGHQTEQIVHVPLKHQFRAELIEKLKNGGLEEYEREQEEMRQQRSKSWISQINPFKKDD